MNGGGRFDYEREAKSIIVETATVLFPVLKNELLSLTDLVRVLEKLFQVAYALGVRDARIADGGDDAEDR